MCKWGEEEIVELGVYFKMNFVSQYMHTHTHVYLPMYLQTIPIHLFNNQTCCTHVLTHVLMDLPVGHLFHSEGGLNDTCGLNS